MNGEDWGGGEAARRSILNLSSDVYLVTGCPFSMCLWPLGREPLWMWAANPGLQWAYKPCPTILATVS